MIHRAPQTAVVVGLGTMAMAIHSSAMNLTVPVMMRQSHLGLVDAQWVIAIYTLVLSSCLVTSGRIGDAVGLRRVYLCGLVTVIASSVLLAANSGGFLLLLRAVEGAGAAMISGTSLGLLATGCAPTEYVRSVGWQTGMTYGGLAAGPLLSGVLSARFHWRAIFVVNVVLCSAAFLLAHKLLDRVSPDRVRWSDVKLAPLLAPIAVIAPIIFILGRSQMQSAAAAWALLVGSVIAFIGAAVVLKATRWHAELKSAWSSTGTFIGSEFLCYLATFGTAFVAPVYLISARHFEPVMTGCILTCQHLARAAAAVLSIEATSRFGSQNARLMGAIMIAAAILTLAALAQPSGILIAFSLASIGFGTGLFVTANTANVMAAAPAGRRGTITGILATCRNLGMTVGVVFAGFAYSQLAGPAALESGFRRAMSGLGAFALWNLIYIAQTRDEAWVSYGVAKMSSGPAIVLLNVSRPNPGSHSSGETI